MAKNKEKYDIVVIGGGSAGLVVAGGAAALGARAALVEKHALGGDCLFTGCVPSKTLIRSARFAAEARNAADFGFETWPVKFAGGDFSSITDRIARVIETVGEHDAPDRFRKMGVEVIFGTSRFRSASELEIEEAENEAAAHRIIRARRYCISTGSRPAPPPIEGLSSVGFITNEEVFRLRTLPASIMVIGGGPIGLELGQSLSRLGSEVTIIEMTDRLLPREDEQVSAEIQRILRAEGIEIHLNAKAVLAVRRGDKKVVTVEAGETRSEFTVDEIIAASGRRPNVEGLGLEAARVKYDSHRIFTDSYLATSSPNIFAAGDVTGHFPFTHMAAYEASIVLRNALFFWPLTQRTDFRIVPWTTFTDPEIARVGLTETEARQRFGDRKVRIFSVPFSENDRAIAEDDSQGFAKFVCVGARNHIAGAHIIGPRAGELIHEVVLAMKNKLPVTALGSMIHVYPTLTQVNQLAGVNAGLAMLSPYRKLLTRYFLLRR